MLAPAFRPYFVGLLGLCLLAAGCKDDASTGGGNSTGKGQSTSTDNSESNSMTLDVQTEPYGKLPDDAEITQYILSNEQGMSVSIINYGAIVTAVNVSDKDGKTENVTLGFNDLDGWLQSAPYFGAIVGRYANRIAKGKFSIDGKEYTLATNNAPNHLHGGEKGFDKVVWAAETIPPKDGEVGVILRYTSDDGEEGYPGELKAEVRYTLNNDNEFKIEYSATCDKKTPVNITNHCYWNLAGAGSGDILDHELTLHCSKYLPVDATLIPTGELAPVAGTPMDFTSPHTIGERIDKVDGGYDHCFVIDGSPGTVRPVAKVEDPKTGRVMEISSDQPGVQFYSGNFLDGSKSNGGFKIHEGFCLETQVFPDSPNHPDFQPSSILEPGQVYRHVTIHKFSVDK